MAQKLKGKEFVILLERIGKMIPVCCGRDLEISIKSTMIPLTRAPKSDWESWLYGVKGYTVSFSGLVIIDDSFDINDLYDAINTKKTLAFVSQSNEAHDMFFSGSILINEINITGSYKDAMTYSISATGTGPLANTNPYQINILVDEDGNAIEDGDGGLIYDMDHGDLLPIDLNINC